VIAYRRILSGVAVAGVALGGLSLTAAAPAYAAACVASGTPLSDSGTSGSPTLIGTAGELAQLSVDSNLASLTGYYKLNADIDLAGCDWTPIANYGVSSRWFQGTLDGDGHIISNLSITGGTKDVGLVGYTYQGTVKNLGVVDATVTAATTSADVGILVGRVRGTVSYAFSTGSISGGTRIGGLVGSMESLGSIANTYSTATVTGTGTYSAGNPANAGGLIGKILGGPSPTFSNSYSYGAVIASDANIGGLVGANTSSVPGTVVTASFYDASTSGQSDTGQGEPKSTVELRALSTFSSANWGIVEGWEAFDPSNSKIWGICSTVNNGYPFLLWELSSAGSCLPSATSTTSSAAESNQGIFLHIARQPGREVEDTPIYFGSVSIKPNSTYILSIQSVTNPALTRTVLATGTTNNWGHADKRLEMGKLAPGTYKVVMTGTHRLDYPLVLTNYISVDQNGNFISLSPESLQPSLS
jgi:hypothetical protein